MNAAPATVPERRATPERRLHVAVTGPDGLNRRTPVDRRGGRPRLPDALRVKKTLRFSEAEAEQLEEVAALNHHRNVTEFLREAVIEALGDCSDLTLRRPVRRTS